MDRSAPRSISNCVTSGFVPVKWGERVENRGLAANNVDVEVGADIHVGASVEEQAAGIEKAVFDSDVQEGCAAQGDVPTGRAAIQFRVAALQQCRVRIKQRGEIAGAAAEQREDTRQVIPGVASCWR